MYPMSKFSSLFAVSKRVGPCVATPLGMCAIPFCESFAAESLSDDWIRLMEHAAFSPRDTAEGVVFAGKMWLSNGYLNGGILTRDLWSSTNGVTWSLVTTNMSYDVYAEMTVYDGKVWAVKQSVRNSVDGGVRQNSSFKLPAAGHRFRQPVY